MYVNIQMIIWTNTILLFFLTHVMSSKMCRIKLHRASRSFFTIKFYLYNVDISVYNVILIHAVLIILCVCMCVWERDREAQTSGPSITGIRFLNPYF